MVQNARWLAFAGDVGYQFLSPSILQSTSSGGAVGFGYWSLSAYAKKRVKDAVSFIGEFEKAIVHYAEKYSVDGVICGHIHSAAMHQIGAVTYYNCGDWVETCSALVEHADGAIELFNFNAFRARNPASFEPARASSSPLVSTL